MSTIQATIRAGIGALALTWLAGCMNPETVTPAVMLPGADPARPLKKTLVRLSPDLTLLNLRNQELMALPVGVTALPLLAEIYLDGNPGIALGDDFGRLQTLKRLSLDACALDSVPSVLCKVSSLEYLSLDDNLLTELPSSLGKLTALRVLSLNRNQIRALPDSVGSLQALQVLNLDNNLILELPATVSGLVALKTLSLAANQLTQLPDAVCALPALESLDIRHNRLTRLPDGIGRLGVLKVLTVTGNPLPRAEMQRVRRELPHTMIVE